MKNNKILIIGIIVILIALLCYVAYYIYEANNNIVQPLGKITKQDVERFNSQFNIYSGKQSGTGVRNLINTIIKSNKEHVEETAFQVSFLYESDDKIENINPISGDIKEQEMTDFIETIDINSYYYVELKKEETDLVQKILVCPDTK